MPADGVSTSTVTVTVNDGNSNPITSGVPVMLFANAGANSVIDEPSAVTNASGVATFSVTDTAVESVTYTADYDSGGDNFHQINQTAVVTFTAVPTPAETSTVIAAPSTVPADGTTASTVTVTLKDSSSNPISGDHVSLTANSGTHSAITPASVATNGSGVATFSVTDTTAEVVTYTASSDSYGPINQTAQVTFASVAKQPTSVLLTSAPDPSNTGQTVTFTANVSPAAATGMITFKDGLSTLGTGALSGGQTTISTGTLAAGTHVITATYSGDGTYAGNTSPSISQVVNPPTTTTTSCQTGHACTGTVAIPGSISASVTGTSTTPGSLTVSVGTNDISCGDPFRHAPSMITVSDQGLTINGTKTAVVTIDKSVVFAKGAPWLIPYAVCYSSPIAFKNITGKMTNLGLLPLCSTKVGFPPFGTPPCVVSILPDPSGNVIETLQLPGYDPKFH